MQSTQQIDHIAIATLSLSQGIAFFEQGLGLKVSRIETLKDRGIRVAFIEIGEVCIELMEPLHDQSEISAFLNKKGPGIHHIAFKSPDITKQSQALTKAGFRVLYENPQKGAHEKWVNFIHPKSTGGFLAELCMIKEEEP